MRSVSTVRGLKSEAHTSGADSEKRWTHSNTLISFPGGSVKSASAFFARLQYCKMKTEPAISDGCPIRERGSVSSEGWPTNWTPRL